MTAPDRAALLNEARITVTELYSQSDCDHRELGTRDSWAIELHAAKLLEHFIAIVEAAPSSGSAATPLSVETLAELLKTVSDEILRETGLIASKLAATALGGNVSTEAREDWARRLVAHGVIAAPMLGHIKTFVKEVDVYQTDECKPDGHWTAAPVPEPSEPSTTHEIRTAFIRDDYVTYERTWTEEELAALIAEAEAAIPLDQEGDGMEYRLRLAAWMLPHLSAFARAPSPARPEGLNNGREK